MPASEGSRMRLDGSFGAVAVRRCRQAKEDTCLPAPVFEDSAERRERELSENLERLKALAAEQTRTLGELKRALLEHRAAIRGGLAAIAAALHEGCSEGGEGGLASPCDSAPLPLPTSATPPT